jgi:hypothetical protein
MSTPTPPKYSLLPSSENDFLDSSSVSHSSIDNIDMAPVVQVKNIILASLYILPLVIVLIAFFVSPDNNHLSIICCTILSAFISHALGAILDESIQPDYYPQTQREEIDTYQRWRNIAVYLIGVLIAIGLSAAFPLNC